MCPVCGQGLGQYRTFSQHEPHRRRHPQISSVLECDYVVFVRGLLCNIVLEIILRSCFFSSQLFLYLFDVCVCVCACVSASMAEFVSCPFVSLEVFSQTFIKRLVNVDKLCFHKLSIDCSSMAVPFRQVSCQIWRNSVRPN